MEFLVFNQKTDSWRGFEPFFHFDVKTKKAVFFLADIFCLINISKKWIHMSVRTNLLSMDNEISGFQSENELLERFVNKISTTFS